MNLKLEGKNVIITGGSDGIGKETARIMAEEGANVIIFARNIENLNKTRDEIKIKTGTAVEVHSVDVKDEKNVKETVDKVVEKNGNIDILVNNAGTSSAHPIMNITDQIMNDDLGTKLFGAIYMIQQLSLLWKKMETDPL